MVPAFPRDAAYVSQQMRHKSGPRFTYGQYIHLFEERRRPIRRPPGYAAGAVSPNRRRAPQCGPHWDRIAGRMNRLASRFMHEAYVSNGRPEEELTRTNSLTVGGARDVFMAADLGVKAVIAEATASVPKHIQGHDLVVVCQKVGLWDKMRPFQAHLTELGSLGTVVQYPDERAYETVVASTPPGAWSARIQTNYEMLDYLKGTVIPNAKAWGVSVPAKPSKAKV